MLDTMAMANLLKGEYKEAFKKIDMYGGMNNVDVKIHEDRMMNLYDMFVEAQEERKPVEKIIGKDIENFCKEYFNCSEEKKWYIEVIKRISNVMSVIFLYSVVHFLFLSEGNVAFWDARINLLPVVVGIIVGFALIMLGRIINKQVTFKKEKVNPTFYAILLLVVFIGGVISAPILQDDINIDAPLDITVIVSGGIAGVYCLVSVILLFTRKDKRKMTKEEKAQRKAFQEELEFQSGIKDVADGMATRYKRKVKKYAKKGKTYTHQDFVQYTNKEIKDEKQYNVIVFLLLLVFVIINAITSFSKMNLMPFIIMLVIQIAVEVIVFRWFVKFNKEQSKSYEIILNECEQRNINVVEYVEQME